MPLSGRSRACTRRKPEDRTLRRRAGALRECQAQKKDDCERISAEGEAASGEQEKKLLVCIVNRHQIVQFQQILARFPGSFSYVSEVTETMGNFKKIRH